MRFTAPLFGSTSANRASSRLVTLSLLLVGLLALSLFGQHCAKAPAALSASASQTASQTASPSATVAPTQCDVPLGSDDKTEHTVTTPHWDVTGPLLNTVEPSNALPRLHHTALIEHRYPAAPSPQDLGICRT